VTFTAPYLEDEATYGHDFIGPQTIEAPFLDGGFGFGHDITEIDPPAFEVMVNGSPLEGTSQRNYQDVIDDVGSFSFQMRESDFAGVDFDDLVTFRRLGQDRFTGVVETITRDTISQGDEASQKATISGNGGLSVLRRALVFPSRGVDAVPVESLRSFSWVSPDFASQAALWPLAKQINRQREYANWRAPLPWIWPDTSGYWIWGNVASATANHAPSGTCLFYKSFTVTGDKTCRIFVAFDNRGTLYVDGAEMSAFESFTTGRYVQLELSSGTHYIAARVENLPNGQTINPAGFIAAGYTVGAGGLLDALLFHTDGTWRCLPYPTTIPGFTHGDVIIRLLAENQGDGGLLDDIEVDFTTTLDSAGVPWSQYREISAQVGRNLEDLVLEMSDAFIDVQMAPGTLTLRAWNSGGRGNTIPVTLQQTTDPATSDFISLSHTGKRARMNRTLIRYADGHLLRDDAGSLATHGQLGEYLELGSVKGESEANQIADQLMDNRTQPAWSTAAVLKPHDVAATPYDGGWQVADTIEVPNESGDDEAMRVRSIAYREDEDGNAKWHVDLRDQRLDLEERHDRWLRRMSDGAVLGGARVSSRAGTPEPSAQQVTSLTVAEFSFDNSALVVSSSPRRPAEVNGNMVEVYGELTTAGTTTTTVLVKHRNAAGTTTTLATLSFGFANTEEEVALSIVPVKANVDKLWCEITAAGTGAEGLDVQVRAI
jgi:hypothetical protein